MTSRFSRSKASALGVLALLFTGCVAAPAARAGDPPAPPSSPSSAPEVRGTWVTTTANDAIASPLKTAETMRRLREIGLNTVYVECWKNGYTQYPSEVLKRTVGVDRRPNLMPQDPSDSPEQLKKEPRDLMQETLIEAHRNGLVYIAWFEYGFMAAHKSTPTVDLWKKKPEWLSRDNKGSEIAPNGFVWMNPLHPEARRFLLDLVLEAVDNYDLDGVQLDDRIVWPYINMGYDDYTKSVYAKEHDGKMPPDDPKDPAWMRWRADKINEYSKMFVQEIRAKRPGLIISLSPAPYPWVWDNYLLEWPKWAGWTASDALKGAEGWPGNAITPRWDEYIPQNYRFSYDAFEKTWLDQIDHMNTMGASRQKDLIAGIRIVGDGKDSSWEQLRDSINLTRAKGNGGHVLWFSRGVLDVYPKELTEFYNVASTGHAPHPKFPAHWRSKSIALSDGMQFKSGQEWTIDARKVPPGNYTLIAKLNDTWRVLPLTPEQLAWLKGDRTNEPGAFKVVLPWQKGEPIGPDTKLNFQTQFPGFKMATFDAVELLVDRRPEMNKLRK